MKRIYSKPSDRKAHPTIFAEWDALIAHHHARVLRDGENPTDYPTLPVAYETKNSGIILSAPDIDGRRHVLVQF